MANNSKDLFVGTKISVKNLKRIFGRKFFQQFQIGASTLWIVDVAKSLQIPTGHRTLVVILRGNKSFQADTRGKCFMFC